MAEKTETRYAVSRARLRRLLPRPHRVNRSLGGNLLVLLVLVAMGAFMVLPMVYSVVNAFKPLEEFYIFPPRFIAINPTGNNFLDLLELATGSWVPFSRYVFNSVFVSVVTTGLYLVISGMCAYVLSKHEFFGKRTLNQVVVLSMMFTSTIMAIPQYVLLSKLGMIDTMLVIIVPQLGSTMGVFLLKQTMDSFPPSIIESARMEGCSEMGICWRIVMPAVKPGWITLIIFTFQAVWNNTARQYDIYRKPQSAANYADAAGHRQYRAGGRGRGGLAVCYDTADCGVYRVAEQCAGDDGAFRD